MTIEDKLSMIFNLSNNALNYPELQTQATMSFIKHVLNGGGLDKPNECRSQFTTPGHIEVKVSDLDVYLREGKIKAIKTVRERCSWSSLKESKEALEAAIQLLGIKQPIYSSKATDIAAPINCDEQQTILTGRHH